MHRRTAISPNWSHYLAQRRGELALHDEARSAAVAETFTIGHYALVAALADTAHLIINAINDRDFATVLSNLDPGYEATWPHATLDLLASGAHEQAMVSAFPDLAFEILNTVSEGDTVVLEVLACGRHDGVLNLPGEQPIDPTGAALRLPMTLVLGFDGPKLRTERLYFDQLTMLRQVGGR